MRIPLLLAGIFLAFLLASGTASATCAGWQNSRLMYVNGNYQTTIPYTINSSTLFLNCSTAQVMWTTAGNNSILCDNGCTNYTIHDSTDMSTLNMTNESGVVASYGNVFKGLTGLSEAWGLNGNANGWKDAINGTITNTVYNSSCKFAGCYDFNGVNTSIVMPDSVLLKPTSQFSVSVWASKRSNVSNAVIVGKVNSDNTAGYMIYDNVDKFYFFVYGLSTVNIGGVGKAADNSWHHYVGVYNGSAIEIWQDGVKTGSVAETGTPATDATQFYVGEYKIPGVAYWNGSIDEVRFWNRSLSAAEIAAEYNAGTISTLGSAAGVNQPPVITIFSPANVTYYNTSITQTFKATDAESATFALKMWDDSVLIYNSAAYANNTNQTYTPTKTGGQHNITVWANDSAGNIVTSTVLYYVWMGLNVSAFDSSTGSALTNWNISITNGTSNFTNTSQNNPMLYEWNTIPTGNINVTIDDGSATLYYFQNLTQKTNNNSAYTTFLLNLTPKSANPMTLSSSAGWSPSQGTSTTIICTLPEGNATLTKDGVTIANPYAASLAFGSYVFNCSVGETTNYRPTATASTLNVLSAGFGCTSNSTFAFTKTIATTANITTLNFSALITQGIVNGDLSDVYVPAYAAWKNTSQCSKCIYVNNTPATSFTVQFGNYIANQSYSSGNSYTNFMENFSTYAQANAYYTINLLDEMTGLALLPPNATTYISLLCSNGISTFTATNTTMLVPTSDTLLDEIKATVQYSATEIYYRNLFVTVPVETKNIYLADANQKQVAQMILQLNDLTGQFSSSAIRIKKQLEGALVTMTENNFDAEKKIIAYLVVGEKYQVYIDNGLQVRNIGYLYIDPVDLTKTITLGDLIALNQSTSEFNYSITYNNVTHTIYASVYDPMGEISGTDFYIYNATNSSSSLLYHAVSGNASAADFTYIVPDATGTDYLARLEVHHDYFGNNTLTFTQLFTLVGSTIPFIFAFPLAGDLPIPWMNLVMSMGVIFGAQIFTGRAKTGIIIIGFALLIAYNWGWWAGSISVLSIVVVLAIINKMTEKRYVE